MPGSSPSRIQGYPQDGRHQEWMTQGGQASVSEACNFIFKRNLYTLTWTYREMKDARSCRVSPNTPAVLPLSKPGFFSVCLSINKGLMLCTLSSGLEVCWHFMTLFLIKVDQPENLFSLEVFFLYISKLCQPQKVLNRVTFSRNKGAVGHNKERTY